MGWFLIIAPTVLLLAAGAMALAMLRDRGADAGDTRVARTFFLVGASLVAVLMSPMYLEGFRLLGLGR
jgi:hypothetical protein